LRGLPYLFLGVDYVGFFYIGMAIIITQIEKEAAFLKARSELKFLLDREGVASRPSSRRTAATSRRW
jgi:hypothetical protein